jgi:predicted membrane channel-forming protein YqfA (hemolysin III family)
MLRNDHAIEYYASERFRQYKAEQIVYRVIFAALDTTKKLDFFPGMFGFHEVWHIFVILGALAHYISIAWFIAPMG